MAMDLKRRPKNRARPRVPRLVSGPVGIYVNLGWNPSFTDPLITESLRHGEKPGD